MRHLWYAPCSFSNLSSIIYPSLLSDILLFVLKTCRLGYDSIIIPFTLIRLFIYCQYYVVFPSFWYIFCFFIIAYKAPVAILSTLAFLGLSFCCALLTCLSFLQCPFHCFPGNFSRYFLNLPKFFNTFLVSIPFYYIFILQKKELLNWFQ